MGASEREGHLDLSIPISPNSHVRKTGQRIACPEFHALRGFLFSVSYLPRAYLQGISQTESGCFFRFGLRMTKESLVWLSI